MSVVKHFVEESVKRTKIDEFLQRELDRAGYGGVEVTNTPLGTHMVVYAMRPGLVIGRGGESIKRLTRVLEEEFKVPNPQISVAEIEVPEFNAYVMASRVASTLSRGVHYRRAGYWALGRIMEAGALGAEIVISGKLRTGRSRYEKFRAGYLAKSGDAALKYLKKAEVHVQGREGTKGVKVRIMPPDAVFPDQASIVEEKPEEAEEEKGEEAKKEEEEEEEKAEKAEKAEAGE